VRLESLLAEIDSVYFLMYDGWGEELESNRSHYARRWARHLPVTLLQPRQRMPRRQRAVPAAGIENCEILSVLQPRGGSTYPLPGIVQAAQVMQHMASRGHERPLLWCYNPWLAALYAALPAVARAYHASENHFDFEGMPELFYRELEAALRVSDVVIPVSSGVADGIHSRVPDAKVAVVTNGCDTACYQPYGPGDPVVAAASSGFARVAVFAGNINNRVDFELVKRTAEASATTLLVFAGPVGTLDERDAQIWRKVLELQNVRHVGRMTADELAALYRSADVGFIPYRLDKWIVRNGFPLKTLEMAATGLPVVASKMQPIMGLASPIAVVEDDQGFLDSFSSLSRSALGEEERTELLEVAAANDYDRKFEQVVACIIDAIPRNGALRTRLDELMLELGHEAWRESCIRIFNRFKPSLATPFTLLYEKLAETSPAWANRLVPAWLKKQVGNRRVE
jgi:glycosyltransferase involved in cell wall biosynthesis